MAIPVIAGLVSFVEYANTAVTAAQLLNNAYDSFLEKQVKSVAVAQQEKDAIESQITAVQNLQAQLDTYTARANDENLADAERVAAKEKIIETRNKLIEILGDEAGAHLRASEWTQQAVESEISAYQSLGEVKNNQLIASLEAENEITEMVIKSTENRLAAYDIELDRIWAIVEANKLIAESADASTIAGQAKIKDYQSMRDRYFSLSEERDAANNELATLKAKYEYNANAAAVTRAGRVKSGGSSNTSLPGRSSFSYGSIDNRYAEKEQDQEYQKKKNGLYYDAKIELEEYKLALQQLRYSEQQEGITAKTSIAKADLFKKRVDDLNKYKMNLENLKKEMLLDFDQRIISDNTFSAQIGYRTDLSEQEKLKIMEVNKEVLQQNKTFAAISKNISEVNTKIKDTENSLISANNELKNTQKSTNPDVMLKEKMAEINNQYEIAKSKTEGYNDPYAKLEVQRALIQKLQDEINARAVRLDQAKSDLSQYGSDTDNIGYQQTLALISNLESEQMESYARLRQAKLDNTQDLRQGLFDITNQLLFEGASWKDIWKNLWRQLAKEAIASLFKVQSQVSLLGLLMRMFGLGEKVPKTIGITNPEGVINGGTITVGGITVPKDAITISDAVISSNTISTMHSGGDVMAGRIGVVPALKDDEVLRTLQVGEEVNSIRDRRSNEILAAVAMRAMDNTAKAPTQVVITALDSRSFAEYLNENSDILQAVLAKNNAMGRRA
ncbi:hypothetical protein [Phascolarctobacterium sp.]